MGEAEMKFREEPDEPGDDGARQLVEALKSVGPVDPELVFRFLHLAELLGRSCRQPDAGARRLGQVGGTVPGIGPGGREPLN